MRERVVTLVCALGALALFATVFLRGDDEGRRDVSRPTTEERRGNGYYAAMTWLYQEHIRTFSMRDRFGKLPEDPRLPPRGNLLIVTLPAAAGFRKEEFAPLERWIRAGNNLLVMAALSDNPDWAFALGELASGDLGRLTGLEFVSAGPSIPTGSRIAAAARALGQPRRGTLIPNRPHAYFEGVGEAVALSDYPPQSWGVKVPHDGFVLTLARQKETGEGVLWVRALGNGRIVVSGFGSLFTNRALGLQNNARLLANIVAAELGPRGAVLFDDVHQGLGASYDPSRFYRDPRLYTTLAILAGLWLAWVLGSTRLALPPGRPPAPAEADFVRATGLFFARVLRPDAGAQRMIEGFLDHVEGRASGRERNGLSWEALERHPRVSREDVRQLQSWYTAASESRRVPLVRLQNLIVKLEKALGHV